jgi:glutamyl-tRNA synthetase
MDKKRIVRTRMAPSPTGEIHVGSMAILLKNYAFAKKHQGQFILRIEDTDRERLVPGSVERIQQVIKDYGLGWDEGPVVQSERLELYQQRAKELVENKKAYYCFCSKERLEKVRAEQMANKKPPKYDKQCRELLDDEITRRIDDKKNFVIRLKVPENQEIVFEDQLRGEIKFNSSEVDDQVLLKSDGFPTYHLAVVVDDYEMKISDVIRGEEWISSTPKHVLLYQAFGWNLPKFSHIPVFLNPDGKGKMSKRKGTVSAKSFLDLGYLPEALLNFFMILGWAKKDEEEIITLDEYIKEFEPKDISKNSVIFDLKKLDWMNGVYIRKLSLEELKSRINNFLPKDFDLDKLDEILVLIRERLEKLIDVEELTSFFYREISLDRNLLLKKADDALVKEQLEMIIQKIRKLDNWTTSEIEKVIRGIQEEKNYKKSQFFMMVRVAVTGQVATPPLFETMACLGKEKVLKRLTNAQKF